MAIDKVYLKLLLDNEYKKWLSQKKYLKHENHWYTLYLDGTKPILDRIAKQISTNNYTLIVPAWFESSEYPGETRTVRLLYIRKKETQGKGRKK
jgi:hypothetical protein